MRSARSIKGKTLEAAKATLSQCDHVICCRPHFGAFEKANEELLYKLGIRDLEFVAESEYGVYHPGRCARIIARHTAELENGPAEEEVELGIMGEVHPDVAEKYGIGVRAYCAELFFGTMVELSNTIKQYNPLPKYPAMTRDIALVVDEDMTVGEIEKVIWGAGAEILTGIKLFDIYRGAQVGPGKKSVAFTLTYRHAANSSLACARIFRSALVVSFVSSKFANRSGRRVMVRL